MSAYIVNDETIDGVVFLLGETGNAPQDMVTNWVTKMGKKLLKFNVDSVNYRYGEETKPVDYAYRPIRIDSHRDLLALVSNAKCYLYQSCEKPNATKHKLYKLVEKAINDAGAEWEKMTGIRIPRNTDGDYDFYKVPAYENAPWGF